MSPVASIAGGPLPFPALCAGRKGILFYCQRGCLNSVPPAPCSSSPNWPPRAAWIEPLLRPCSVPLAPCWGLHPLGLNGREGILLIDPPSSVPYWLPPAASKDGRDGVPPAPRPRLIQFAGCVTPACAAARTGTWVEGGSGQDRLRPLR